MDAMKHKVLGSGFWYWWLCFSAHARPYDFHFNVIQSYSRYNREWRPLQVCVHGLNGRYECMLVCEIVWDISILDSIILQWDTIIQCVQYWYKNLNKGLNSQDIIELNSKDGKL